MAATGQTYTTGGAADATLTMFGMQGKQVKVTPGLRLNGTYTGPVERLSLTRTQQR